MIGPPQIVQTAAQCTAIIRLRIPRAEIQNVMGPAIGEVMTAVSAQGMQPAGPVFSHHLPLHPDTFDFEVGVPLSAPSVPAGRVQPGHLPAARVARTVYRGSYDGLGGAWGGFEDWLAREGHQGAPDFWECSITGPESGQDPAGWSTQLNRPQCLVR